MRPLLLAAFFGLLTLVRAVPDRGLIILTP
jgi:hypothetical protein